MRKPISIAMCDNGHSTGYAVVCDDGKMYARWDTGLEHSDKWVELPNVPQDEVTDDSK